MDIQKMSIEEKIARLSETDKAYVLGYVDRALRGAKQQKDDDITEDDDESELEYEHEEGRYDAEL